MKLQLKLESNSYVLQYFGIFLMAGSFDYSEAVFPFFWGNLLCYTSIKTFYRRPEYRVLEAFAKTFVVYYLCLLFVLNASTLEYRDHDAKEHV